MKARLLYCAYTLNYLKARSLLFVLSLTTRKLQGTNWLSRTYVGISKRIRQPLISRIMKSLKTGFPSDFCPPSHGHLPFVDFTQAMASISPDCKRAFESWLVNDFKKFVSARNRAIEKSLK